MPLCFINSTLILHWEVLQQQNLYGFHTVFKTSLYNDFHIWKKSRHVYVKIIDLNQQFSMKTESTFINSTNIKIAKKKKKASASTLWVILSSGIKCCFVWHLKEEKAYFSTKLCLYNIHCGETHFFPLFVQSTYKIYKSDHLMRWMCTE